MPRYPDIEPNETGLLDSGDGNLVYWETCGNPDGVPALIVHGGPGSGCTARNDLGGGACTPWELARAWPGSELIISEDSGHTGSTTMTDEMHAAADRLYEQITNPA